ncbi:restriction endonuclease subunit S [Vibrio diabolicus]|uniref:restriction endonuclease subunit S n=1 Tax=Vibrio diabolicus TaxID=50719 RepID=UPI00216086B0|nr:restriction endonuclease subunit S [Vibrio diabolicus]MCS0437179.1 restriction endonuclease subunit S [Vibrio diabolicus]
MSWPLIALGDLCHTVTKGTTPTSIGYDFASEGIPFLRIQNLRDNSVNLDDVLYIASSTHQALKRSTIKAGDVLITIAGTIGRTAIVPSDFPECNCNQAVAIIRFDMERLYPLYLLHWLNSIDARAQISGKKVTATISNLSLGQIKNLKIPLPPLETQKQIAAVLEKADQLRKDCQQIEQELNSLAQSVFIDMFGDPVTNPKGWELSNLPNHGSFKNGLNFSKDDSGVSLKYLGVGDFKSLSSIRELNNLGFVDVNSLPADDYLLKNGDLVFVRSNGNKALVGRCISIYPDDEPVTFSGFCIRYRVESDSMEPEWLNYMLRTASMKQAMLEGGQGANIQNINQKILSSLEIPLPPIDKQRLFCKAIESYRESLSQLNEYSQGLNDLFNSLMQKAFKGHLNL